MSQLEQARETVLAAKALADAKAEVARLRPEVKEAEHQHASCVTAEAELRDRFSKEPSPELAEAIEAAEASTKVAALFCARARALERAAAQKVKGAAAAAPVLAKAQGDLRLAQQALDDARSEHVPAQEQLKTATDEQTLREAHERDLRARFLAEASPALAEEIAAAEREVKKGRLFVERAQALNDSAAEKVRTAEADLRQARLELDRLSVSPEYLLSLSQGPAEQFADAVSELQRILAWLEDTGAATHQIQHTLATSGVEGVNRQQLARAFEQALAPRIQPMLRTASGALDRAGRMVRNIPPPRTERNWGSS